MQLLEASAPSNDDSIGFDLSTKSARANCAGVGGKEMDENGIEDVILQALSSTGQQNQRIMPMTVNIFKWKWDK
jgi:hypothetical protein